MVLSDTTGQKLTFKKWFITCWAFMENFLFGGLLFGWGSLSFVLKMENIYSDLCEDKVMNNTSELSSIAPSSTEVNVSSTNRSATHEEYQEPCKRQDENMALCFTIATAMVGTGSLIVGVLSYKFGTRVTRLIAFAMFESGTLMMIFVAKERPWLMFPGFSLISMAGLSVMITNFQVSYLFTEGSSTVVGLLNGAFDTSSIIMLFLKIAHEHGFMRQTFFIVIAACHVSVLISSLLFLPKYFIDNDNNRADAPTITKSDTSSSSSECDGRSQQEIPSLKSCFVHPQFLTSMLWMSILNLRFVYYIGTLNQYLNTLLHTTDQVSFFTDVCYYIMLSGIVGSFVTGAVYDWQKRICKDGKSVLFRDLMPSVIPLSLTSLSATILSVLVLIPVTELLYPSFIVMTIYRAFLYSTVSAFLRNMFPSQYFGFLFGTMHCIAAVISLLQYALFTWSEAYHNSKYHADAFLLCLALLSFTQPFYWGIRCWKDEMRIEDKPSKSEAQMD